MPTLRRTLFLLMLVLLPLSAHSSVVVDFDAGDSINATTTFYTEFGLNTAAPTVTPGNPTGYVTGPDLYVANNRPGSAGGTWGIATFGAGGLRTRLNNPTQIDDCLFLFKTESVRFDTQNDTLQAASIFCSSIDFLDVAQIRMVIEEAGVFYISESSTNFADTAATGSLVSSFAIEALEATWYAYAPTTTEGVSVIGASASPTFENIGFIGFTLFTDASADNTGVNFGVREFSATAATKLEAPLYPFPQMGDYTGRGTQPNREQTNMNVIALHMFDKIFHEFMVSEANDPETLCLAGEMRFRDGGDTRANMQSWMMMAVVLMDDGGRLDTFDGTANAMQPHQVVFDRMLQFARRHRKPGITSMWAGVNADGSTTANVNAHACILGCVMAYYQWGDASYRNEALAILDDFYDLHVVGTGRLDSHAVERKVIKPGAFWGYSDDGHVMADMAFASPAYLRAFDFIEGGTRWNNPRKTIYWMIDNLRSRSENQNGGVSTGLLPNFMGIDGQLLLRNGTSEYLEELDTGGARYKYALDYLWFANDAALPHLSSYADWWLSLHPSGSYSASDPQHSYLINGTVETPGSSVTRAGGLGVAAMVAGGGTEQQNIIDSSYDHCVTYANESFVNAFLGLHTLFNLLIFGGNFPAALVGGSVDVDADGAPDFWELDHGFDEGNATDGQLDADRDGTPNWLEAQLSLSPHDAAERFSVTVVPPTVSADGALVLSPASRGISFSVERSESLEGGWIPWINGRTPSAFTSAWSEVIPPQPTTRQFYRVRIGLDEQ